MTTLTQTVRVDDRAMAMHVAFPAGDGPFPAIVVIQHAPGVDTFLHAIVERLADNGYFAAAPDLYHRFDPYLTGMEKLKLLQDSEVIADVDATVAFLRRHPAVDGARLGIAGFCMGGRMVYLMSAVNPNFKAAVAYYGGNIMKAWGTGMPSPYDRTAEIACPLLFHFGADDTNPSPEDMHRLDQALNRCEKPHEFHVYDGAGHAFMNFTNPERYRESAAGIAWSRTLAFFTRHLGTSAG